MKIIIINPGDVMHSIVTVESKYLDEGMELKSVENRVLILVV